MIKAYSVNHGNMVEKFRTIKGSRYFQCEDGTWIRKKYTGETFKNYNYLGSIDTSVNPAFVDNGHYNPVLLREHMNKTTGPYGFTKEFRIGFAPLGILWSKDGKEGIPHVGDAISKVFD